MNVKKQTIQPTYKKENKLWVLNFKDIKLPENFKNKEQSVVYIPPGAIGGNHKHPRTEIFIGIGELELVWINKNKETQREFMNKDGELFLYEIPPMTPHAVINASSDNFGMLIEYASDIQKNVEEVKVI